jgi:hypothetical protein
MQDHGGAVLAREGRARRSRGLRDAWDRPTVIRHAACPLETDADQDHERETSLPGRGRASTTGSSNAMNEDRPVRSRK